MLLEDRPSVFINLHNSVDVDEELLEILLPYLQLLIAIGIDFTYAPLQQAIEAHFTHLEAASQATLGYAGLLATKQQCFGSPIHATACMTKALIERWIPHREWEKLMAIAPQSRYISPYEAAYRLIQAIQQSRHRSPWRLADLDRLSDREIEQLLPIIQQFHQCHAVADNSANRAVVQR